MNHPIQSLLAATVLLSGTLLSLPLPAQTDGARADGAKGAPEKIALLRFSGLYADHPEMGGDLTSIMLGGGAKPKPFYGMIEQIDALAGSDMKDVLVDLTGTFSLNQVQIAELERSMQRLRRSGKHCYAYIENADSITYQIASLCDEVMMANLGTLDLPAPSLSVTFLKDAFDLLGVQMDVVRCGEFKGAVEPYLLSKMSKHLRDHYVNMLAAINAGIVTRIADGRNLADDEVRTLQAERLIGAQRAKDAGLIDSMVPWKGARAALAGLLERNDFELEPVLDQPHRRRSMNFMQVFSSLLNPKRAAKLDADSLVVLHLSGEIVDGTKPVPGSIVSGSMVETIRGLGENDKVKGVVVRINSPGGSATASEAILLALQDLAAQKPAVVSMGSLAASGGYYVTCFGSTIFAEASTITGSIGVFGTKPSLGALMRRIGVHEELVALDEAASMSSLADPWSDTAKQRMQSFVNRIYDSFLGHVAKSRDMSVDQVTAIAGGRVWSGEQALKRGLVDRIGGLEQALALCAKEAKIGDYEVHHLPQPRNFFDSFAAGLLDMKVLLPDPRQRLLARKMGLDRSLRLLLDAIVGEKPSMVWAIVPETLVLR